MFRKFLAGLMLAFACMFMMPGTSHAQAQQQPPAQQQPGWTDTVRDYVMGDNDRLDGSKKQYTQWREYFQTGDTWCWSCRLFSVTAKATLELGQRGTDAFAEGAAAAVAAFMGLWVMWQLYLMLSVSHANSPAQSIDTIFNRLVVMMVVLYLLNNSPYDIIMQPFLETLGAVMAKSSMLLTNGGSHYGSCSAASMSGGDWIGQGNILLCGMQKEMGGGLAIGAFLMDAADFSILNGHFDVFQWSMGLLIFCVFGFMIVILPFKFFDALVRIAVVAAIIPLVILAFLFKPTRGVVKQAVTSLLTAMLTFLFTAISIAIAVSVLNTVTSGIYNQPFDSQPPSWFGPLSASDFMVLLTAALGMASMISNAGSLAAEFAGFQGQMGNAGSQGANMITGAANLGGKAAGGAAGAAFTGNRVAASVGKVIKPGSAG